MEDGQLPNFALVEYDGVPDQNIVHLANQIYMFGLFLVGNMDKLVATRVCTGLSYLNTVKQAMAILNIGLSGIEISIDPNTEE